MFNLNKITKFKVIWILFWVFLTSLIFLYSPSVMGIDKIVEEKIKFGPAQYVPFIFLCLVDMNDGAQLVLSKKHLIKVLF